jgi:thioester reductase-like protein
MIFASDYPPQPVPNVPLHEYILENYEANKDNVIYVDYITKQTLTMRELSVQIDNISKNLVNLGLSKQDVVCICLPNHILYPGLFYGIAKANAIITPMNPVAKPNEIHHQLRDSKARFLVTLTSLYDKCLLAAQQEGCKIERIFVIDTKQLENTTIGAITISDASILFKHSDAPEVCVEIEPDTDIVIIPYSSGTTGISKGVLNTHKFCVAACVSVEFIVTYSSKDVSIAFTPFCFAYGLLTGLITNIRAGCLSVIMPKFDYVDFINIIQTYKVTCLSLVPTIINAIIKDPNVHTYDFSMIRYLLCGAAPLSKTTIDQTYLLFPNAIFHQAFGMTECGLATLGEIKEGSCGRIAVNVELKFVDIEDRKTLLGRNQKGELCIRGPKLMSGYLNNPEATANTLINGWLHSGDIAYIDDDGDVFIVDRLKELIKCNGAQVAPAELEGYLLQHDAIQECIVIGVPDDSAGEVPKAVVVRKPGYNLSAQEVMKFVNEKVNSGKYIRYVQFVDSLPRTGSNKIQRGICRSLYAHVEKPNTPKIVSDGSIEDVLYGMLVNIIGSETQRDVPLTELGIDSLKSQRVVTSVQSLFGYKLDAKMIFNSKLSLLDIARLIRNQDLTKRDIDWDKERVLDPLIVPDQYQSNIDLSLATKRGVFLTGCTGFLGCFLLEELLKSTSESCKIYCLVRSQGSRSPIQRIKHAFNFNKIPWNDAYHDRVVAIEGSLGQPMFGLDEKIFKQLSEQVDVIYHNGANVNWVMSYEQLKSENVLATQEAIRLACTSHLKPLHYVSTIGVVLTENGIIDLNIETRDHLYARLSNMMGYGASKWVSEEYIRQARSRGVPVTIFRPGMIGTASNGASNPTDWITRFVIGCVTLGAHPTVESVALNYLPVDFIAKLIVTKSQQVNPDPILIVNSNENELSMSEILRYLRENKGVKQMSWEEWQQLVNERIHEENIWPLRSLFKNGLPIDTKIKYNTESMGEQTLPKITMPMFAKGIEFMLQL